MGLCLKYGLRKSKRLRSHSVQEIVSGEGVTIASDTRVKTDVKLQHDRPDLVVLAHKRKEITIIEVGITGLGRLIQVETEKQHKYDLLAKELGMIHKSRTRIIPYVIAYDRSQAP